MEQHKLVGKDIKLVLKENVLAVLSSNKLSVVSSAIHNGGCQKTKTIIKKIPSKTKVVTKKIQVRAKKVYIAAKTGKKFHISHCPFARNIKPNAQVRFKSKNSALNKGYKPCKCV